MSTSQSLLCDGKDTNNKTGSSELLEFFYIQQGGHWIGKPENDLGFDSLLVTKFLKLTSEVFMLKYIQLIIKNNN